MKIELASFPTYQPAALAVRSDLDVLGRRPLITALQPAELLTEKITAVLGRRYLKPRDLFDLWYLDAVLQTPLDPQLLRQKVADYSVEASMVHVRERIASARAVDIGAEMDRFLPQRYRAQLGRDRYDVVRVGALKVLREAAEAAARW